MQNLSVIFRLFGQTGHPNAACGIFGRNRINMEQRSTSAYVWEALHLHLSPSRRWGLQTDWLTLKIKPSNKSVDGAQLGVSLDIWGPSRLL